jgi:hypothetical protein
VLYGENVIDSIEVRPENLRLILERELKSALVQLREGFLIAEAKPKRVRKLMVESLSTILVLFRAALRLYQPSVPPLKIDALKALASHVDFDATVFLEIEALKEGKDVSGGADRLGLFERYLETVESVVDKVDAHVHSG